MNETRKGLWYLHSAILLLGGTALFSKLVNLPSSDITLWRGIIASLVLFALLTLRGRSLTLQHPRDLWLMILCGGLMGIHWATYFHAMKLAGVAVGLIALYTYPIITVFLEPVFKGHKPHWSDIGCALIMLLGVVLLVPDFQLGNQVTQGVCWGIFSAVLFALRNVLQGHYLKAYPGETSMVYQAAFAALAILPFMTTPPQNIDSHNWVLLLVLGCAFTALPHTFFANSLRVLKAKTVSLIGCLQPVYGAALAFLVLSEQPEWTTLTGGLLIVGAAAFETGRTR